MFEIRLEKLLNRFTNLPNNYRVFMVKSKINQRP